MNEFGFQLPSKKQTLVKQDNKQNFLQNQRGIEKTAEESFDNMSFLNENFGDTQRKSL